MCEFQSPETERHIVYICQMWSLGNEVEEQYHPEKGVVAYLRDIVRLYDSTRPVTLLNWIHWQSLISVHAPDS